MFFSLSNLFLVLGAAMTPQERLRAMGRLDTGSGTDFLAGRWLELAGWLTIALLITILGILYKRRKAKKASRTENSFCENATRLRLNGEEQDIVAAIAALAGIKQRDSIFTLRPAFDTGLSRLMREVFATNQESAERRKFHEAILSIKIKLGFISSQLQNGVMGCGGKERTTRQIPAGTEVWLLPPDNNTDERLIAEITQNDNFEFSLRPEVPVTCHPGDIWTVRYNNGAMIWEFEAIVTACSQDEISFGHSERIRYVNRRRFTRVPTDKPAKIALFPVFGQVTESKQMELSFVPAVITEIAGPSVRVGTDLSVQIRQRVLLVFDLEEGRLVQDVGEVRDIRKSETGDAIIVELIGLHAKAIGELVRVANQIAHDEINETEAEPTPEEQMEVVS
ncbi:MAG: PilZ domain-containing protein [Planctomycetota bacterium]|jgi:hypothetical protein